MSEQPYSMTDIKYDKFDFCLWGHPGDLSDQNIQHGVDYLTGIWSRFIKEGDVVVDVGAYTGDTSIPMALLAGKTGLCLSFEPNRYTYEVLCRNASLNHDRFNIVPFNYAVGMPGEEIEFHYSDPGRCNGGLAFTDRVRSVVHLHPVKVKCISLSKVLETVNLKRLSFIKTDTEGHDLAVIKSIRREIDESGCVVQCEVFADLNAEERLAMVNFMRDLGYKPLHQESLSELSDGDIVQPHKVEDVLFVR